MASSRTLVGPTAIALLALAPAIAATHSYSTTSPYDMESDVQTFFTPDGHTFEILIASADDLVWGSEVAISACGIEHGQSDCDLPSPTCRTSVDYGHLWGAKVAVHRFLLTDGAEACGATLGTLLVDFY